MMKKPLLFVITYCLLSFSSAPKPGLVVVVEGLRNGNGKILAALSDRADDFPNKAVLSNSSVISGSSSRLIFKDVKPGRYALAIIHDENDNGKLDTNALGIPVEGFAFGNNAMGVFGPPSFKKASFEIENGSVTQEIRIRYF